ncbi:MAG TPA: MaoC family dehydratase [Planktothrix sp.]|jgi:acyl dehydratase
MDTKAETSVKTLFLEDLAVGQKFVSEPYSMDTERIKSFASQFDPQPFHLDEEAAKSTFFGGLAASGWHTAAVTMRLLVSSAPFAGGLLGAGGEIKWPQPTRPGDILLVESEILEIRQSKSRPERGIVTIKAATINQNGEVVQTLVSSLVVRTRHPEQLSVH